MIRTKIKYLLLIVICLHSVILFGQKESLDYDLLVKDSRSINNKDTLKRGNIKINLLKLAFNEISVTYEHFRKPILIHHTSEKTTGIDSVINKRKKEFNSSTNYIIGFIYPSDVNHLIEYKHQINYTCVQYFDDPGLSPFINWGLSLKLDFRRYRNTFYWGPEFVEKFVFYPKTHVDSQSWGLETTFVRLQSGYANVLGFGYFIGWQKEYKGLVTDLFFGAGGRYRLAVTKIWEEQYSQGPNVIFTEPIRENYSRAYPSLNFGIRLGFIL